MLQLRSYDSSESMVLEVYMWAAPGIWAVPASDRVPRFAHHVWAGALTEVADEGLRVSVRLAAPL